MPAGPAEQVVPRSSMAVSCPGGLRLPHNSIAHLIGKVWRTLCLRECSLGGLCETRQAAPHSDHFHAAESEHGSAGRGQRLNYQAGTQAWGQTIGDISLTLRGVFPTCGRYGELELYTEVIVLRQGDVVEAKAPELEVILRAVRN